MSVLKIFPNFKLFGITNQERRYGGNHMQVLQAVAAFALKPPCMNRIRN